MRLLLLTPRTPYPPIGGDRLRLVHLVRHLVRHHEVTLYTLAATRAEAQACRALASEVTQLRIFIVPRARSLAHTAAGLLSRSPLQAAYFHAGSVARAVRRLLGSGRVDAAVGSLIRTAPYLLGAPVPVVIDVQDSLSLHYRRALPYMRGPAAALYRLEIPRLERLERQVLRRAAGVTAISPVDRDDLCRREPGVRVVLAGNGVDLDRFRPREVGGPTPGRLVFLANLRTVANRDMAVRCATEILPRVRREVPAAHLHLVGTGPAREVRDLHDGHGVHVTGEVDHPAEHLRGAVATLCPMRFGAGMQNKILESLAVAVPAVVSSMAAAPLGLSDGDGVLIADGAEAQALACQRLLAQPALRAQLGRAGRAVVERRFRWESNLAPFGTLVEEVAGPG